MKKKRIYNKNFSNRCRVCVYLKAHEDLALALKNSTYFNLYGTEDASSVLTRYEAPFKPITYYSHVGRHQKKDMEARRMRMEIIRQTKTGKKTNIQGVPIDIITQPLQEGEFRMGLDEFIKAGREKLKRGEMPINAQTYLTAIKIKVDDEAKNKDRKASVLKELFKGADGVEEIEVEQPIRTD